MNYKLYLSLFILIVTISLHSAAQYCTSSATNGNFEYISRVKLGAIDNQSGSNLYSDYTSSASTELFIGKDYNITITTENYFIVDNIACWIDWNQNAKFEIDEYILLNITGTPNQQAIATAVIKPPLNAITGTTRMRVLLVSDKIPDSCLDFTYGEVEDYTIIVRS